MGTNPNKELLRFISEDVQNGDITSGWLPKNRIIAIVGDQKRKIFNDLQHNNYQNRKYPAHYLLSANSNDTWIIN